MKAMVLAAGVGSRLDPLTSVLPKPLVPVVNKPVMEHILRLLRKHNFTEICANLHYLPQNIREYFGDGSYLGVDLTFQYEAKLSGDAGGVRACRSFLQSDTFIVIMGDLITDADLSSLIAQHKAKKAVASIALKKMADVSRFGVVVLGADDFITGFQEKPKQEDALSNLISTGIYILEPEVFNFIPETGEYGFGRQLFPQLVESGQRVLGIEIEQYWSDVGTIEQYREANLHALAGKVDLTTPGQVTHHKEFKESAAAGCEIRQEPESFLDPSTIIDGNLLLGKNSVIARNVKIKGNVVIGDDCVVEADCQLMDSVIWSGSHIERGALVVKSVVGKNCLVRAQRSLENEAMVTPLKTDLSASTTR